MKDNFQKILSMPSGVLDAIGRLSLRFYLYRENAHFNPDLNGEHFLINRLKGLGFRPDTIFDIGANEGRWSDFVLSTWPEAQCHLFEPMPSIVARLTSKYAGNPNVKVHPFAVGGEDGMVAIHENHELSSHSFVSLNSTDEATTPIISGASALARAGAERIDLCKIDAEGFDLSIIQSLEGLLAEQRISMMQFEHHALAVSYGITFDVISSLFKRQGYRLGKLHPSGLREVTYGSNSWGYQIGPNFVAAAPSHHDIFEQLLLR